MGTREPLSISGGPEHDRTKPVAPIAESVMWILVLTTILMTAITVLPASARQGDNVGGMMITGGADVVMKGEEFGKLVVLTLLHALLCDETAEYGCHGEDPYYRDDSHYVENEIELSAVQFGTGVGYFLSPGLALGGRVMLQSGGARPEEVPTAGVGPELTYFTESHGRWTPFVAAGALYTRELGSTRRDATPNSGSSVLLRTGLYAPASRSGGFYLQISFQQSTLETIYSDRGYQRFGFGLGFTAAFDR